MSFNSLVRTVLHFNAITHSNLNEDSVATETLTSSTEFSPKTPNVILDITYDTAPSNEMVLISRRLERRKTLGFSSGFDPSFTGDRRSGMPIGLAAGFFQIVEQQIAGTAGASQPFRITFQQPLNV